MALIHDAGDLATGRVSCEDICKVGCWRETGSEVGGRVRSAKELSLLRYGDERTRYIHQHSSQAMHSRGRALLDRRSLQLERGSLNDRRHGARSQNHAAQWLSHLASDNNNTLATLFTLTSQSALTHLTPLASSTNSPIVEAGINP